MPGCREAFMDLSSVLIKLSVVWGVITGMWIVLVIYRGMIGRKEEDQVFLTSGEERLMHEQEEIARKLKRLSPYVTWIGILSLVLLLVVGGLWLYYGFITNA